METSLQMKVGLGVEVRVEAGRHTLHNELHNGHMHPGGHLPLNCCSKHELRTPRRRLAALGALPSRVNAEKVRMVRVESRTPLVVFYGGGIDYLRVRWDCRGRVG
mgnify:CR=1 FL=1